MSIGEAFNRSIEYYDDWMMKALPNYDDLFGTALDLLTFAPDECNQVLDLGAGTGLFSKHVLEKYPKANFVLYDLADKMLDVARKRFENHAQQFRYVVGDYRKLEEGEVFDLVISSLSTHHLEDEEKRALFGSIYRLLRKGGIFINIDQIRGETPLFAGGVLEFIGWNRSGHLALQKNAYRRVLAGGPLLIKMRCWQTNCNG